MTLLLSHGTALRRLRMIGRSDAPAEDPRHMRHDLSAGRYYLHVPFADEKALSELDFPWARQGKLDVLVPSGDARRRSDLLKCHVWQEEPPPGAFRLIGPNVLISSPAFTFLQMAATLDLIELIRLGYELCGSYVVDPSGQAGLSSRPAIATPDDLLSAARHSGWYRGHRKAIRALRHILPGSASPRETDLAMLLTLPVALGGYGLPKPHLNHEIRTGGTISGSRYADLYWQDAKLDVEYESSVYHAGTTSLGHDSSRRAELREVGIDVLTVTNDQILDRHELDRIARLIEAALDIKPSSSDSGLIAQRDALREEVLCPGPNSSSYLQLMDD